MEQSSLIRVPRQTSQTLAAQPGWRCTSAGCPRRSRTLHVRILGVASMVLTATAWIYLFDSSNGWRSTSSTTSWNSEVTKHSEKAIGGKPGMVSAWRSIFPLVCGAVEASYHIQRAFCLWWRRSSMRAPALARLASQARGFAIGMPLTGAPLHEDECFVLDAGNAIHVVWSLLFAFRRRRVHWPSLGWKTGELTSVRQRARLMTSSGTGLAVRHRAERRSTKTGVIRIPYWIVRTMHFPIRRFSS